MSTAIGRLAEETALRYLEQSGHKLIAKNWRTRWCEIDLITKKAGIIYFVEVKYRRSANFGSGIEYITAAKIKQMNFASEFWISANRPAANSNCKLAAISLSGEPPVVDEWIDDIL